MYRPLSSIWSILSPEIDQQFTAIGDTLTTSMNDNELDDQVGMRLLARLEAAKTSLQHEQSTIAVNLLRAMERQVTAFMRAGMLGAGLAYDLWSGLMGWLWWWK